ncbi:GUN4 domain-containing protein [Nostoc sp.]|uniref:GUN4 domain-containing protein n=1 Tax=Nostoc sp. TaxID=1180 RepID=UPI002FFA8A5E
MEEEKKSFEQSYKLQSEKIARLRNALVIETDPLRKFQYEQQIKNEETELKRLTDRLDEIEKQLQSAQSIPVISEPKSIQQTNMSLSGQQTKRIPSLSEIPHDGFQASEVGANYFKLGSSLSSKNFKEADEETARIMLWVARREKEGWLTEQDIKKFPCRDLRTIDQFWLASSNGKFGFSVQNQIWIELGGKLGEHNCETFSRFCETVEWWEDSQYDLRAVCGHLPRHLYQYSYQAQEIHPRVGDSSVATQALMFLFYSLAQRLIVCNV